MRTTEIIIVDDCVEWRARLRKYLELVPGLRVVAEAADGLEAVEKAAQLLPDIVLLDIGMPRLNGIAAAKKIMQVHPESNIIFLTQENDIEIRGEALATGAAAYVVKSTAACELQPAIESVVFNRKQEPHQLGHRSLEPATLSQGR